MDHKYINEAHKKNSEAAKMIIAETKKNPLSIEEAQHQILKNSK